ncbi:MAG TPA: porin family protein [Bacteroidia bacterium]|nr:porin family protein [Bacteroidia bacterium]
MCSKVNAQDSTHIHLPGYDNKKIHVGFILSINFNKFKVAQSGHKIDSLQSVTSNYVGGISIGGCITYRIKPRIALTFSPNLDWAEHLLDYSLSGNVLNTVVLNIQSTFLHLPLELQLHTKRFHNKDVYFTGGLDYTDDLAASQDSNSSNPSTHSTHSYYAPVSRNSLNYIIGGGISFFLRRHKLSFEIRYSGGLTNLLVPDNTIYTQSLSSLYANELFFTVKFGG